MLVSNIILNSKFNYIKVDLTFEELHISYTYYKIGLGLLKWRHCDKMLITLLYYDQNLSEMN